jgi:hypothetical protein
MRRWFLFFILCNVIITGSALGSDAPNVWTEDALVKVFPDTPASQQEAPVIRIQCAKNEYEPAQVHIRSKIPLEGLTVKTGDLSHESGKYVIPSKDITWNFTGYIPIEKNSIGSAPERVVKVAPCEIPDPLLEKKSMNLPADRTQSVWITFYVPKDAPAGKYSGKVELVSKKNSISVPVELEVWDFTVPDERHLFVTTGMNQRWIHLELEKTIFNRYGGYWIWDHTSATKIMERNREYWHGKGRVYFRRSFDLPDSCKKAQLIIRGDSAYSLFVNDKKVGDGGDWFIEKSYEIGEYLVRGKNLIAMEMKKSFGSSGGVYAALDIDLENGKQLRLATDSNWRVFATDKNDVKDWNLAGFDDSKWGFAGKAISALGARGAYFVGLMYEDERYWKILPAYLSNLAAHRNNICSAIPWKYLVKIYRENDGSLSFDYEYFDRYVELLHHYGLADRLDLGALSYSDRHAIKLPVPSFWCRNRRTGAAEELKIGDVGSLNNEMLSLILKDLEKHLESKGWADKAMIHLADEPFAQNIKDYKELSRKVHQAAPCLKRIEPINTFDFGDDLDVWVPVLHCLDNFYESYKNAQRSGKELWYYTCNNPWGGFYLNRGLDYPLTHMRLLHWFNYRYDLAGYLHWGYNQWYMDDPFGKPAHGEIAAPGDAFIVYPGKDGPLNSLRWEAQRDGLEDYEYLWVLGEKMKKLKAHFGKAAEDFDPTRRGKELCNQLITSMHQINYDPVQFRKARAKIAQEIMETDMEPLALVWTFPLAETELTRGSAVIQVYGVTEPGTAVKINTNTRGGIKGIYVGEDGRFCSTVCFYQKTEDPSILTLNIELSEKNKHRTITRTFKFRK